MSSLLLVLKDLHGQSAMLVKWDIIWQSHFLLSRWLALYPCDSSLDLGVSVALD